MSLNKLTLIAIFCTPLYLLKINIFGIPSNFFELLVLIVFLFTILIAKEKKLYLKYFRDLPVIFIFSCFLIILGVLTSIYFNDNFLTGLGILKGWFAIPILFSVIVYSSLKSGLYIDKIYKSIYLSAITVGFISILYKFFGIMTYDNRLSGFYLSPNHLAMYLSPGIFFGLYFLTNAYLQKNTKLFFLNAALLGLIFFPLYYTYSYGAWIALFVSLILLIFFIAPKKYFLISISLLALLSVFSFQWNSDKLSALTNFSSRSSLASRQMIWQTSLVLIKESPILGIGPGNFQPAYLSLQPRFAPYLDWAVPQPHNIFIAFWLQSGMLGFIGFLSLLFFVFRTFFQIFKDKKNTALAAPLLGFFLYTLFHGIIDTPYWKNDLSFLFWLCVFMTVFLHETSLIFHKPKDK